MTISPEYRRRLVIMVKEPRPGRVKTRLGRDIGMTDAAWWFRHQSNKLIARLRDPRWQLVLAVSPDHEGVNSRVWPADLERWPQGTGDIGARMGAVFRHFPKGPVLIIGADIPGITKSAINRAFSQLGNHEFVFGPATDGGFWLVGTKRTGRGEPAMFTDVRWSSEFALSDCLARLTDRRVALIDTLSDIDTADDLARFVRDDVRAT